MPIDEGRKGAILSKSGFVAYCSMLDDQREPATAFYKQDQRGTRAGWDIDAVECLYVLSV
jgi:hypothetical protein